MKRIMICLLLCLMALFVHAAAEAPEITKSCAITLNGKRFNAKEIRDRYYSTYSKINKGAALVIDGKGEEISGVMLKFYDRATLVDVQAEQDGEWITVSQIGTHLADWAAVPAGTKRVRLVNTSAARLFLDELYVYGAGDKPAAAQEWTDAEKADMLVFVGHPDDELLWFGGLLPTYAGERGLMVQVVYAVKSTPLRRLELLDGLWHCGVTAYPDFIGMRDVYAKTLSAMYKKWSKNTLMERFTEMLRKYRPDVLVTQDFNGEYGHGAHRAVADASAKCYAYAADSKYFAASAEKYGTWQVKKLYVHLCNQNQIRMDWHQPLAMFGGKDSMKIATEALDCHASQVKHGWAMTEGGDTDNTVFGLYFTEVGLDEAGNDLMEHIGGDC